MKKKIEEGSSLSYVMYIVAIIMVAIMYKYGTYTANLYVLEQQLENALHVAESAALAADASIINSGDENESVAKTLARMKIVSASSYTNGLTTTEKNQLKAVANSFSDTLINQLELKNNVNPKTGVLYGMCGENSKVLITGEVVIYEPTYNVTVVRKDNPNYEEETNNNYADKEYIFDINYEINNTQWVKYTLKYSNNTYTNSPTKKLLTSAPTLSDGRKAEGATIEATVGISFAGIPNIFAGATKNGYLFAASPETDVFDVKVTQAMDIVAAETDSRKK